MIAGVEYTYTSADLDTDSLTGLSPALTAAADTRVDVYPLVVEKQAHVVVADSEDSITVRVPHALADRMPEGIREPEARESVSFQLDQGGEFVIVDILGQMPVIGGVTYKTAESGRRVEINGEAWPNGIGFYTGHANETYPGTIGPGSTSPGLDAEIILRSPEINGLGQGTITLTSSDPAGTGVSISAATIHLTGTEVTLGLNLRADSSRIFHLNHVGWTNLTLDNSWATASGPANSTPGYRLDPDGYVTLRGVVTHGASGAAAGLAIATLPAGLRPPASWYQGSVGRFVQGSLGEYGVRVTVTSAGVISVPVVISDTTQHWVALNGIRIPTF